MKIDIIPSYDIEKIILMDYTIETRKTILSNLTKYIKLKHFNCSDYNLNKLPDLPNSLIKLDCSFNNLTKLPNLPNSLINLDCCFNNIIELPNLPNSLEYLNCVENNLTELPNLPNSLIELSCSNNNLTELPDLPNSLIELYCSHNNLSELPDLPNSLIELYFKGNNLTYHNLEIKFINEKINFINETNLKNRIIKRMKLLNRTLLLEHSARICLNPKRIQRLLDTNEIDFYDNSFDTLTS